MVKKVLLAVLLLSAAQICHAEMSVALFKQLHQGSELEKYTAEMYLNGVANGYSYLNTYLADKHQPQLFCYDADFSTGQLLKLTADEIRALNLKKEEAADKTIEEILLGKLQRLYPCP
jgi:hypothetical protein